MKVVKVLPIAKELLPHKVSVLENGSKTSELSFVRIERVSRLDGNYGGSAILYYDCENSRPADFRFTDKQIFAFEGKEYACSELKRVLGFNREHHYELLLG